VKKNGYDMLEDVGFSTKGMHYGIDSLAIPLWKKELFSKGKIYSNETHENILSSFVLLKNITDNSVDSIASKNGEYSFLVHPNKKYRVEVHKEGFIPDGFNLNTKDLYRGELLNDIVLEEVYIEKEVGKFSYNKYDVPPESYPLLNHIIRTLKKFPTATVNISAYADARGTKEYNQKLSDKRAEAAVQYLVQHGVSRTRITARGFGEDLIINRCSDGVECSEEEHSKNRRVELKVQHHPIE
jgi:outer membrane protein OmpA-like peptidoglycan-associated protein